MKRYTTILLFLLMSAAAFGQKFKVDKRYERAVEVMLKEKEITKTIKKVKGKKALKYQVDGTMIPAERIKYFKGDLKLYDSRRFSEAKVDAIANKRYDSYKNYDLASLIKMEYTGYLLHFSHIEGDLLFAELDGRDNGKILIVFVFNRKKKVERYFIKHFYAK